MVIELDHSRAGNEEWRMGIGRGGGWSKAGRFRGLRPPGRGARKYYYRENAGGEGRRISLRHELRYDSPFGNEDRTVPTFSRTSWTNKSVLEFAGKSDPVSLIEEKARQLVLRARDAGWSGPPYNPIAIADLLKIPIEASSDVVDARTVATAAGVKIEFNPTRPREPAENWSGPKRGVVGYR
jgi:hypothetical protein